MLVIKFLLYKYQLDISMWTCNKGNVYNIISLFNSSAPGDKFKVEWIVTLEAYVEGAMHVSITSFVCSVLLGGWAHSIECTVLLKDWYKNLHTALSCGFFTEVVTSLFPFPCQIWNNR